MTGYVWRRLACGLAAIGLTVAGRGAFAGEADLILTGGKIVTVDPQFRVVQALAVKGKTILAVGTDEEIVKLAGAKTERVDLGGKTVIPGLIDSHVHPPGAAMYEYDHPVPEMETIADVLAYVAERARTVPKGEWINLSQVFVTRLRDQRFPNRRELDAAAPEHPVAFRTGPDAALNSLALKLSGIDKDFQIADGGTGYVERDPATGEPNGILRSCSRLIKGSSTGKSSTEAERLARLKELFASYNSLGITSVTDRNASDAGVKQYQALKERGELTCRVYVHLGIEANATDEQIAAIAKHPLHAYDDLLWLRGVKCFLDGGMLTGSAYMRKPWGTSTIYSITDPAYRGLLYIQPEPLARMAKAALKHDLQFTAHSVGDAAVDALLDAYATVDKEFPVRNGRPCITHCNFMSPEAIARMKQLGVVADLQPVWLWLDGATLTKQFGDERMTWFQPYKTLFEQGVIVGGGSDHMQKIGRRRSVNSYDPFLGMWIALARQPRGAKQPLHPEQSLTREQALRLYTVNNAWLTFEEKTKGSLEPGKLADVVVLETDYLTCPLEAVKDIEVERTYLGGKLVYRRATDGK